MCPCQIAAVGKKPNILYFAYVLHAFMDSCYDLLLLEYLRLRLGIKLDSCAYILRVVQE